MLKSNKKNLVLNSAVVLNEHVEAEGKGRKFVSRFIEAGVAHYQEFGDILITKETLDKFINTMIGCPVIINHKDITEKNADEERVGVVSNVWYNQSDGWYYCEGIIWDKQAIDLVKNHNWNVSCTYDFESDFIEKTHNGKKIDMEFTNGKFLHLALVNNPRYERANIVMNGKDKVENDRWITVHPNGEENKGKHLLIKDGESVEDAMHRNGWYKKRQAKDEKSSDENIKSKIQKSIEQSKKTAKNPKFYDGFDVVVKDGIVKVEKDGKLSKTGFKYDEGATDDTGEDWNTGALGNLIQKWNAENPKQSDKEEKSKYLKKGDLETDKVYKLGNLYVKPFVDDDGDLAFYDRTGAWGEGSVAQKFLKSDLKNLERAEKYDKLTDKELKFLSEKGDFNFAKREDKQTDTKETKEEEKEDKGIERKVTFKDKKYSLKDLVDDGFTPIKYTGSIYKDDHLTWLTKDEGKTNYRLKISQEEYNQLNPIYQEKLNKKFENYNYGKGIKRKSENPKSIIERKKERLEKSKQEEKQLKLFNAQNGKDLFMTVLNELENFVKGIVENACDKKEKIEEKETIVENEDKRKLIDEVGGILKGKVDEEVWRTIIGKIEKIAYEPSEDTKADNKCKNEDDEKEEKEEKFEEEKEIAENKKAKNEKVEEEVEKKEKVENSMDKAREIAMGGNEYKNSSYISQKERLELGNNY